MKPDNFILNLYNLIKQYKLIILVFFYFLIFPGHLTAKSIRLPLYKPPVPDYNYQTLNREYGVLSVKDIDRYKKIFYFQKKGNWDISKKYIQEIDNDILMGHVLFQKYMHPTSYRSSYTELSNWLKKYRDHPGSSRIYKLAKKRQPKGHKNPLLPLKGDFKNKTTLNVKLQTKKTSDNFSRKKSKVSRKSKQLYLTIKSNIKRDILTKSENRIYELSSKDLNKNQKDDLLFTIAEKWYFRGDNDQKAFQLASTIADRSRNKIIFADWIAGLSAWRLKKYKKAQYHFEKLASSEYISTWNVSAAAFWASRASLKNKNPEKFIFWLRYGSKNTRTFYGIICKTLLGEDITISNTKTKFLSKDYKILKKYPSILRIIALEEIGQVFLSDKEAFNMIPSANSEQAQALLKLANKLNLPNTSIKLAVKSLDDKNIYYDTSAYPIPDWKNHSEFILDQALVYAFVRQESRFNSKAKSHAGARGLMQLMPRTASFVAKDRRLRYNHKHKLYEPDLNLTLGQLYVKILMKNEKFKNNLFLLVAAYNAGPTNINKWLSNTPFNNDPLLFIESIPARETRIFIERVLANLWIYRMRFNQDKPSLLNIVEGKWPKYMSQDNNLNKISNLEN
ncbi:MAG: Soluble lytic murein transglycosylase [Alphaproteobacteria bacterium MarineAlpha2_Bin1]|nr:MAG: Soluble lytic murein transglycosylase [Alphaproteobacteria bacterium MarineAlpha2_Bin1]